MDVKEFAQRVQRGLQKTLGEEAQVILKEVRKNNGVVLQGVMIAARDRNVSPTIYLDSLLEQYEDGETLGSIVRKILQIYKADTPEQNVDMEFFRDFQKVRDRIAYRLIHAGRNRELLESIPHIEFLDLAICFYYCYNGKELGNGSILIYNTHMEMWDTSTLELFLLAQKNTRRICGTDLKSMEDIVRELLEEGGAEALLEEEKDRFLEERPMIILSNRYCCHGAACILYPGLLEELAQKAGKNLFILPSSIHEVILLPDTGEERPEELRELVREVNTSQVRPEEILSDSLYYFDFIQKNLKIIF